MSSAREPASSRRSCATARRALGAGALICNRCRRCRGGDDGAGLDAIAFVDAQLEQPAADFRRDVDLGRLDVTGDAQSIGGGASVRARQHAQGASDEQPRGSRSTRMDGHDVPPKHASHGGLHVAHELVELPRLGQALRSFGRPARAAGRRR